MSPRGSIGNPGGTPGIIPGMGGAPSCAAGRPASCGTDGAGKGEGTGKGDGTGGGRDAAGGGRGPLGPGGATGGGRGAEAAIVAFPTAANDG